MENQEQQQTPAAAQDTAVNLDELTKSIEALTPEQQQEARDRLRDLFRPERDRIVTEKHKELQTARAEIEALKVAGMSEAEKAKRELEVARAEAAERAAALEDREAELIAREIAEATGLPAAFRPYLKTTDRDEAMKRAKEIAKAVEVQVADKVRQTINTATHTPAASGQAPAVNLTREQLKGMTNAEIVEAFNSGRITQDTLKPKQ